MKREIWYGLIATFVLGLACASARASEDMDWAYPVTPPPKPMDNVKPNSLPGSARQYTLAQINDPFAPPDWFPDEHPPMPAIVAAGNKAAKVSACALCHLPSGNGHPESSDLAGLPEAYIVGQMTAFKEGRRTNARTGVMTLFARAITEEETKAAAAYFAALKPLPGYNQVVETEMVRKSFVGSGAMRFATTDGATEPVGSRIIVLPQDPARAELRDPKSGFVDHVPVGSIRKGEALAQGGDGKTIACAICHGPNLKGLGDLPGIAGRSGTYIFRQLNDMQSGKRTGPGVELMKAVVAKLSQEDMIALAAYLTAHQ